ncbi:MAG: hypothetical protein GY925_28135 [Actinomycetia bacterium]|nr:hypothetical protein [Actinomycetes bacterium]
MGYRIDPDELRVATYGAKVTRATATLPQSTSETLFTVATGKVVVTLVIGTPTVAIQDTANNTKLQFDPDNGAATVDLSAALDVAGIPIDRYITLDSAATDALKTAESVTPPANMTDAPGLLLGPGLIILDCAASATGSVTWDLFYKALTAGARVVAV